MQQDTKQQEEKAVMQANLFKSLIGGGVVFGCFYLFAVVFGPHLHAGWEDLLEGVGGLLGFVTFAIMLKRSRQKQANS